MYVNGYNHMWLNHTIGNTGICISFGASNGRLEDSIQILLNDKVGDIGITTFFCWSNGYDHIMTIAAV